MKTDEKIMKCFYCDGEFSELDLIEFTNYRGDIGMVCENCYDELKLPEPTKEDRILQYIEDSRDAE